jgi:3-hydroxyisobutyrate dehydrogenase
VTASRIGFVGLGNMGEPMVRRLASAGHAVRAYDKSKQAAGRLAGVAGVTVTETLHGVLDDADVVILMLPDSGVVEQVLLSERLLEQMTPPALLVDMSSSEPARTRALAERAAQRGVTLLDAPVSGGVTGARNGSLTIMAGGPADVLPRLRPVLDVLGSKVVHAGGIVGAGHAVKALNNLMSAAHLLASSEALIAGRRFGLDPAVMLEIINGSSGRSWSTENKWPNYILTEKYDAGFPVRLMVKDIKLALSIEHATGVPSAASEAVVSTWEAALADLPPDADHTAIARWLNDRPKS